ncbi:Sugar phosphate isomerase/epimerase [Arthrobacter crystallopoietes]|uniref:Sugar phosphate isomerase/epimerase n=2 Tax=Crystallibacter crystallopoietes TaxID=37928 RepID=A0A1H0ZHY7_9MICC|nr:Sugar phosphate isomerase/epimerase [Arthrobacter crystallopoietes]
MNTHSPTSAPALIATCWTSAGDAAPLRPSEASPIALSDRIAAIAATGWAGIGLVHADLILARETIGYPELARQISEAGLSITEIEFLNDWWATGSARESSDTIRADLFEAATALGARHIKIGAGNADVPLPISVLTDAFGELADDAASTGIQLALEATPFSNLRTTQDAIKVVTATDSPSAGLMIDIWHTAKTGLSHEELWSIVPMDRVAAVEIDDGYYDTLGTIFEDTINRRTYCGEGEFDTAGFVQHALKAGYRGPWGVEIISETHRNTPVYEGLQHAFNTAVASFPNVSS